MSELAAFSSVNMDIKIAPVLVAEFMGLLFLLAASSGRHTFASFIEFLQ
jgi:hypothetical protein